MIPFAEKVKKCLEGYTSIISRSYLHVVGSQVIIVYFFYLYFINLYGFFFIFWIRSLKENKGMGKTVRGDKVAS